MKIINQIIVNTLLGVGLALTLATQAMAQDMPAPFNGGKKVKIALVRFLSTGDFFAAYLAGVKAQSKALGVDLRIFDSRQNSAVQADMMDQAIALGVDGIVVQHGLTDTMMPAVKRAVDAGIKVVAFDVNVNHPEVVQIEQDDYLLAKLGLEQALKDNGTRFKAGYVYVPGIAPLDRRHAAWEDIKAANPNIKEVARFGTLDNPIANSNANQAAVVLRKNPEITVMFAPYDEFAKGVKIAVDEAGMSRDVKIYSADISTADIQAMREPDSPWAATVATNPKVVGEVSVRTLAMVLAGENLPEIVKVPPVLITRDFLIKQKIRNMRELAKKHPSFSHVDVSMPSWMPAP